MRLIFLSVFLISSYGNATVVPAFTKIDSSYSSRENSDEIDNMPRITSQDGLGICYAHVAATMMQAENCKARKLTCSELPESQLFSALDLTRLHIPKNGQEIPEARSSYQGLDVSGGNPHEAIMIGALGTKKAASEACLSLDRVLSKMNSRGETVVAQQAMWMRLKNHFEEAKKLTKGKEGCADCLSNIYTTAADKAMPEVERDLDLKVDNVKLAKAFASETFEKFLDDLLGASDCRRPSQMVAFENSDNIRYETFPDSEKTPVKEIKDKVKSVLRGGRPLALGSICLGQEDAKSCQKENFHAVVIAGFRTICNPAGKCRDSFKVVNSWGKSWQDQHDGGWVDADSLLAHTKIAPNILGWFADKK